MCFEEATKLCSGLREPLFTGDVCHDVFTPIKMLKKERAFF